jgi:predicted MFS family arabinose efflux permease
MAAWPFSASEKGMYRPALDRDAPAPPGQPALPRGTVWVLAAGCGMTVANLYYGQPLLADMARDFGVSEGRLGGASALTQAGYALGLLLVVPLGDAVEQRRLILALLGATAAALVAVALAPGFVWLAAASLLLGAATVVPQLLVPFAAGLAAPAERGWVVGRVMSGLLVGILASRTVSGFVGARLGWRAVYGLAAGLTVALAAALGSLLPRSRPAGRLSYAELLRSFGRLLRAEPVLLQSCLFGAAAFGAFSVLWTTLAFYLARPPFDFGSQVVGLFGLAGVAGALAAPIAGKLADRRGPMLMCGTGLALVPLSFGLLAAFGDRLAGLIAGVVLLDFGVQASHISNQARIYRLPEAAHNRLNAAYMVSFFIGGAAGSSLGTYGWTQWRWAGVCATGAGFGLLGLAGFLWAAVRRRPGTPASTGGPVTPPYNGR